MTMSVAELTDLPPFPSFQRSPQAEQPTNGLWTSRTPILLPPLPVPGRHVVSDHSRSSLPLFPRDSFGLCASKSGDVYFYGGRTEGRTDELYRYCTRNNTVTPIQCWGDSPGDRYDHAMILVGDVIVLHGGGESSTEEYADSDLYLLNLVSHEWSRIPVHGDAPEARDYHSMAVIGTTIYMFSGTMFESDLPDTREPNELWSFDLNTLRTQPAWELVVPSSQSQPSQRIGTQIVAYENQLILFGGYEDDDQDFNDVWSFDVESRVWSELQCTGDIPSPRSGHATVVLDDIVYVIGGLEDGLIDVFALKISDHRWFKLKDTHTTPAQRESHAAVQIGTTIFIFGGLTEEESEKESIHVLNAHDIDNSDIHIPERLMEFEAESRDTLTQGKSGIKLKEKTRARSVKAGKMRSDSWGLEERVKALCAELQKERIDTQMRQPAEELCLILKKMLTDNSNMKKKVKELEYETRNLKHSRIL